MTDYKKLFVARGTQYQTVTRKIINDMKDSLAGIEQFIELDENQTVTWEDVGLVDSGTEDGEIILVTGISVFELGSKVKTNHGEIEITEQNQHALKQVYRIGIPLEMVKESSTEKVLAYLMHKKAEAKAAQEKAAEEQVLQVPAPLADEHSFDLAALTEEQRVSLKMFELTRTKS